MAKRTQALLQATWRLSMMTSSLACSLLLSLAAFVQVQADRSRPGLGDGGPATSAEINGPVSIAVSGSCLYIAEGIRHVIRRVDLNTGIITTLKTRDPLEAIGHIALDSSGGLLVVEFSFDRIRRVDLTSGSVKTIAGGQRFSFKGDGGPASRARLNNPSGLAFDDHGNLYVSEFANNRVRRVDAMTGIIKTIAGNGRPKRIDVMM